MFATARHFKAAPVRSREQRLDALAQANHIRSLRASLKADIKRGDASICDVLLEPPDFMLTAKVIDLLMAVPKRGKIKSTRLMEECRISPSKTLGGLSERQRAALLGLLSG